MLHIMFKTDPVSFSERAKHGPKGGGQEPEVTRSQLGSALAQYNAGSVI